MCIKNKGYEASLEVGKLYRVMPRPRRRSARLSPNRRREWRGLRLCRRSLLRNRPAEASGEGASQGGVLTTGRRTTRWSGPLARIRSPRQLTRVVSEGGRPDADRVTVRRQGPAPDRGLHPSPMSSSRDRAPGVERVRPVRERAPPVTAPRARLRSTKKWPRARRRLSEEEARSRGPRTLVDDWASWACSASVP